ncbi:MAG: (Fe-S)-binding protein [Desulfobacterales bacterium]|nr:(Fe-S)-binding protein [Desulfobacterales bacterium]
MLLKSYQKQIFRPECNPSFQSVHCIARLDEDISAALPYLNAELGGTQYFRDPPAVMLHVHGKIIKVGATEIAINALKDEAEADKILEWLKNEVNRVWAEKDTITPSEESRKKPQVFEILKLLPKTNCKKCGLATCMVFAAQAAEGGRGAEDCPEIDPENKEKLDAYLAGFRFE